MLKRILIFGFIILAGCIDPINFKYKDQQKHLVVEASFTNDPELNYVKLTYAQPYTYPFNEFVKNAQVYVTSTKGERYDFSYGGDGSDFFNNTAGNYYPVSPIEAMGVVGNTYTLHVVVDGKAYESEPVTLKPPVPIDKIHFKVDEQPFAFKGYKEVKKWPGYQIMVDYQDPAEEKNFLRWTFASQYEVLTQPEDYINPATGNPAPKGCCARCYLKERLDRFKVTNDRLVNGQKVINQEVLFLPFERYLGIKHKLKVYQHSLTEEAYEFFRIMEQQRQSTGTVFDPPPAEVQGNIFNVADEGEQVIGFFDASAVSMKEITILSEDIQYPVAPFKWPDDCRTIPTATTEMPKGW